MPRHAARAELLVEEIVDKIDPLTRENYLSEHPHIINDDFKPEVVANERRVGTECRAAKQAMSKAMK